MPVEAILAKDGTRTVACVGPFHGYLDRFLPTADLHSRLISQAISVNFPSLVLGLALIASALPNTVAARSDGAVVLFDGRTLDGWRSFGGGKFYVEDDAIVADGDRLQTWLNGVPVAEVRDSLTASGHIALQLHGIG